MGSMGKRRRRRVRSNEPGGRIDIDHGPVIPTLRHSPYTIEGIIEAYGTLARHILRPPPRSSRRALAREMAPWIVAAAATFVVIVVAVWLLLALV
jgi:hypothetical protein